MGLWNFFGGNKIGPGHPRYERELRKHNEAVALHIENICTDIMLDGISIALKRQPEEDIIKVLKRYPNCPKFPSSSGVNVTWGLRQEDITHWKEAQRWLREKEKPEQENPEYIKYLEQKIKDQEERIKKLEKLNDNERE